jgi:hypothetical protein
MTLFCFYQYMEAIAKLRAKHIARQIREIS